MGDVIMNEFIKKKVELDMADKILVFELLEGNKY